MKVVVAGAGAIGANIAYRLQARGAQVVLVEAGAPGSGTSRASFSWLSSFPQMSWSEDTGRSRLRVGVKDAFRALHAEIGGDWLQWSGTLTYASAVPGFVEAVAACRRRGVKLEVLGREDLARLAPELAPGPDDEAFIHEPNSGWVDVPAMIDRLLAAFGAQGGTLVTGRSMTSPTIEGEAVKGVVLDDGTALAADHVVNAAGSWASHVAAAAGIALPVDLVPGVMIYARGEGRHLPRHVVNGPAWLIRPETGGGVAIHWRGEGLTSVHGGNGDDPRAVLQDMARHIPALEAGDIEATRIGIRAIPHGGPVLGALPWLRGFYIAVSHGGVGWGPTWGNLVATELLDGRTVPELEGMRPERFYMAPQRLGRFADDAEQASDR